jgi:hypothetical protein
MKYLLKYIALSVIAIFIVSYALADVPSPPDQPAAGPGGSDYKHEGITVNGPHWAELNENSKYIIYEPAKPVPEEAPVVMFLHGWGAISPKAYLGWINHIVRKGYIAVWVQYQRNDLNENPVLTLPWRYSNKIITIWKDALKRIDGEDSLIRPERDDKGMIKTAIVGHSAGGYLGMIIASKAAAWKSIEIPVPFAVVAVEPGGLGIFTSGPFKKIDPDTKMIIVVGDEDDVLCKSSALRLWRETAHVPDENKEFLLVQSDYHGEPEQIANHYFPGTVGFRDTVAVDARDFYVTYKLSVGALDCAFSNIDCENMFGNGSDEQLYMGEWSDGQPIVPMLWVEDPSSLETTCEDPRNKLR